MRKAWISSLLLKLSVAILISISINPLYAQCPPNIDFENGNFDGWKLYEGTVTELNGINLVESAGQILGRHVMYGAFPGNGTDPYGGFPVNCPNGSLHSIRLGNDFGGGEAEGVSYEFTIPATAHQFNITYYYAVVFQDPGHGASQQPRLEIEVENLTDNTTLGCSSFSFIASSGLPGFHLSTHNTTGTPVWYKDWSANSINLDGNEGKTIRLFFKTSDCTFIQHFGYAYIDVSTNCTSSFEGPSFCAADPGIDVLAPFGYESYIWHDQAFTQILGNTQTLHLSPPPPSGTVVSVELIPYAGYGCKDTISTTLTANLSVVADAGPDKGVCDGVAVQIGVPPTPGIKYKWVPATGLNNPDISNPISTAATTTLYTLTASSPGGGCTDVDQVTVGVPSLNKTITLVGSNSYCTGTGQSSVLKVSSADIIKWYKDDTEIAGANLSELNVTESGDYKAILSSNTSCSVTTETKHIDVYQTPFASFAADNNTKCYPDNNFALDNAGSIATSAASYTWSFGDTQTGTGANVSHIYDLPGTYNIKLLITDAGGCVDDTTITVSLKPGAKADFSAKSVCVDLPLPLTNNTLSPGATIVNYLWEFGNGQTSGLKDPIYTYTVPGPYIIKLSASTPECPQPTTKEFNILIDEPAPNFRYADQSVIINFPEILQSRHIGNSVLWDPVTNLSNPYIYNPYFKGSVLQLYNITLTTASGCVTVDTLLVKPYKKIEIHVPTAFTPNGDGKNDALRPLLYGFKKMNFFRVFDRWGKLLYQSEDEQKGWDGKVNGIQQDLQTVIWIINAEDVDGHIHEEKGSTVILR